MDVAAMSINRRQSAEALLRKPRSIANAFEVTVERLGTAIRMGLFAPGEQLPTERDLSELMGVSRSTVREAIRVLTIQGLLSVRRGRSGGTFVADKMRTPTVRELHKRVRQRNSTLMELLDHRFVIEPGIAALAAERASREDRSHITDIADQMGDAVDDFPRYRNLDTQFHFALARATGVRRITATLAEIHAELSDLMALVPLSREACLHANEQHARIARAIAATNRDKARREMSEHVLATSSFLKGLLG